jgi:hypothetical protein
MVQVTNSNQKMRHKAGQVPENKKVLRHVSSKPKKRKTIPQDTFRALLTKKRDTAGKTVPNALFKISRPVINKKLKTHKKSFKTLQAFQKTVQPSISFKLQNNKKPEPFFGEPVMVFKHPFTCIIAGPTQSGKTVFTKQMLKNANFLIQPPPTRIIWAYGEENLHQNEEIQNIVDIPITFVKGLPDVEDIDDKDRNLLILDDLMSDVSKSDTISNIFTRASHHRNMSVIFIVQNIFHQGKTMRDISINAKYTVLFKNPRETSQIQYLNRQIFPNNKNFLVDAYRQATQRPHGYLILDFDQSTPNDRRVITGIFFPELPIGYIAKNA